MTLKKFISLLISTVFVLTSANLVFANTNNLSSDERQYIVQELRKNDVSEDKIDSLINKLENGELWDSFKPEYQNVEPQSYYTDENGSSVAKYIYPDGSIRTTTVALPEETSKEVSTRAGIAGGNWQSGAGYRICRGAYVSQYNVIVNMSFYADYCINENAYDEIMSIYSRNIVTYAGTYSDVSFSIPRNKESNSSAAFGELSCRYEPFKGSGSTLCTLQIQIRNDRTTAVYI